VYDLDNFRRWDLEAGVELIITWTYNIMDDVYTARKMLTFGDVIQEQSEFFHNLDDIENMALKIQDELYKIKSLTLDRLVLSATDPNNFFSNYAIFLLDKARKEP